MSGLLCFVGFSLFMLLLILSVRDKSTYIETVSLQIGKVLKVKIKKRKLRLDGDKTDI
jgi:hypothetical protein